MCVCMVCGVVCVCVCVCMVCGVVCVCVGVGGVPIHNNLVPIQKYILWNAAVRVYSLHGFYRSEECVPLFSSGPLFELFHHHSCLLLSWQQLSGLSMKDLIQDQGRRVSCSLYIIIYDDKTTFSLCTIMSTSSLLSKQAHFFQNETFRLDSLSKGYKMHLLIVDTTTVHQYRQLSSDGQCWSTHLPKVSCSKLLA